METNFSWNWCLQKISNNPCTALCSIGKEAYAFNSLMKILLLKLSFCRKLGLCLIFWCLLFMLYLFFLWNMKTWKTKHFLWNFKILCFEMQVGVLWISFSPHLHHLFGFLSWASLSWCTVIRDSEEFGKMWMFRHRINRETGLERELTMTCKV